MQSVVSKAKKSWTPHGLSRSGHYNRWNNMMLRCYCPGNKSYQDYGGRGIRVCERWHDIRNFIADLPDGYFKGAELDRIDNDGDYEPANIKWSTRQQSTNNRRSSRWIEFSGKTQTMAQWAHEFGLDKRTVWQRLDLGWSIERALTAPKRSW